MPPRAPPGGRRWSADDPFKLYFRTNNRTGLGKGESLPDDDLEELREEIDDMEQSLTTTGISILRDSIETLCYVRLHIWVEIWAAPLMSVSILRHA